MTDKRINQMTPAARAYRRRVIAMLTARYEALDDLWEPSNEVTAAKRATLRIKQKVEAMR